MRPKLILVLAALTMMLILNGSVLANDPPPSNEVDNAPPSGDEVDYTDQSVLEDLVQRLQNGEDLSNIELDAVVENYLSVASIQWSESTIARDGIPGCDTHSRFVEGKNAFLVVLYRLTSETYWCYDGTYIDGTPEWDADGDALGLWWEFVGKVTETQHGGDGDEYHRDYVRGHFRLCPPFVGCLIHEYPWIRKWQYGSGQKKSDSGG